MSKLIIVLQIVTTPDMELVSLITINSRPLMDPVFSWMMRVGTLFNIL